MELCRFYGVSRSGYYKWLGRSKPPNRYERTQNILDHYVRDIHSHYPSMGYQQIRDTLLLQTGWNVCDLSVWKSMKRLHIKGYVQEGNIHLSTRYSDIGNRMIFLLLFLKQFTISTTSGSLTLWKQIFCREGLRWHRT